MKGYGEEVFIFVQVVAVLIDARHREGTTLHQYGLLAPVFFLEEETHARLGSVQQPRS